MNRFPISLRLPDGYKKKDFSEELLQIVERCKPRVINNKLLIQMYMTGGTIDKFDKTFDVMIIVLGNRIIVKIKE